MHTSSVLQSLVSRNPIFSWSPKCSLQQILANFLLPASVFLGVYHSCFSQQSQCSSFTSSYNLYYISLYFRLLDCLAILMHVKEIRILQMRLVVRMGASVIMHPRQKWSQIMCVWFESARIHSFLLVFLSANPKMISFYSTWEAQHYITSCESMKGEQNE